MWAECKESDRVSAHLCEDIRYLEYLYCRVRNGILVCLVAYGTHSYHCTKRVVSGSRNLLVINFLYRFCMLTVRAATDVINLKVLNTRSYPLEE
jgi:hypothetical protein